MSDCFCGTSDKKQKRSPAIPNLKEASSTTAQNHVRLPPPDTFTGNEIRLCVFSPASLLFYSLAQNLPEDLFTSKLLSHKGQICILFRYGFVKGGSSKKIKFCSWKTQNLKRLPMETPTNSLSSVMLMMNAMCQLALKILSVNRYHKIQIIKPTPHSERCFMCGKTVSKG